MIELVRITPEETWAIRHTVMWPEKPFDYVKVENDARGDHFGLRVDGAVSSVVSCFYSEEEMQFRKFATLTSHQGKGYGTLLLKHVFEVAFQRGVKKVWCNARREKKKFYERFGMKESGPPFFRDGVEYVLMETFL
jgi:GNAT superfamily N-acetyltransferase